MHQGYRAYKEREFHLIFRFGISLELNAGLYPDGGECRE